MTRDADARARLRWRVVLCRTIALLIVGAGSAVAEVLPPGEHYEAARGALARGKTDMALLELKLALQDNPLDAAAHSLLGCLLARQGEDDQAIAAFHRALAIDPTQPEALHNLGTMLVQRGEAVLAAEMLESAVAIRPDDIRPYNSLAKAYFLAGLPQMAVATYGEVLRRDPSNHVALENMALINPTGEGAAAGGKAGTPGPGDPAKPADTTGPTTKPLSEPAGTKQAAGAQPSTGAAPDEADAIRELLGDMPQVTLDQRGGRLTLTGWTRGSWERELLNRILADWPDVRDLTSDDVGDPQRMLEVDAILFTVTGVESHQVGFNFLDLIQTNFTYFASEHNREGTGFAAPGTIGAVGDLARQGWLFVASVDYAVNIANATENRVAVVARPHLTTLSGTPANVLVGGEIVFKVSGNISGDIKPYPFGTTLKVTPTLLRTRGEDGTPRIHMEVEASRTSALDLLAGQVARDQVVFDKLTVNSQTVLGLGQTLILSGLNQRETRTGRSGVPGLRSIPILKYLFSTKRHVEVNTAVIILVTPRDPAFIDATNRKALEEFVEKRRAFVRARQGTEEDMRLFRERYPDWDQIPPNRFASHFFLSENSEIYRTVSGQDLVDENLDLDLLGTVPKERKKKKSTPAADD